MKPFTQTQQKARDASRRSRCKDCQGNMQLHHMCSVRFEQPYEHTLRVPGEAADRKLIIQQAPFGAEGFASTGAAPLLSKC